MSHRDLLDLLNHLAGDDRVRRVILSFGPMATGLARIQELGRALDRLRAAGKEIVANIESMIGTREYLLAARCSRRVMAPSAMLALTGFNMELTYLRGLLDKADVEPELLVAGKYKNMAETFMRKSASRAASEMTEGLLDELYGQLLDDLGEALGKKKAAVAKLVDGGPYSAERARQAGLVDELLYRDELLDSMDAGHEKKIVQGRRYGRFVQRHQRRRARMIGAPVVALVHVTGAIRDGRGDAGRGMPGAGGYVRLFRKIRRNSAVKAVVLRVSSPGGVAGGSDLMRRELQLLAAAKPLVVSMGDVAASGGYMIAVPGKMILAERGTLTGSIGVVAGKFAISGLLAKLGINVESHRRGDAAGVFSGMSRFSEIERKRMTEIIKSSYESFKGTVAEGRGMSKRKINAVAEGRVWTGSEALAGGLIDDLGGLGDALQKAKDLAGGVEGEPVRLWELPVVPGPWRMLLSMGEARVELPSPLNRIEIWREMAAGPYAGLPFELDLR